MAVVDCGALFGALDAQRRERDLDWYALADELWQQSSALNAQRPDDHPLCGGAVSRLGARGTTTCQYALFMLRWLHRAPEDFLTRPDWFREDFLALLELLRADKIHPVVVERLPLTEARRTHGRLESSATKAKLVLVP